jgi:ribosomal protein S18 acetylase RimI-like enzyme
MNIIIREYRESDEKEFRQSIIDLQNYECAFDPEMLSGEEIVDAWFNYVFEESKKKEGQIYVAEDKGKAVGFISLRIELKGEEILLPNIKSVYVTDFIVSPDFRGKGVGKLLMAKADESAKEKNISYIKLNVFSANSNANEVYHRLGFKDESVTMIKKVRK